MSLTAAFERLEHAAGRRPGRSPRIVAEARRLPPPPVPVGVVVLRTLTLRG